MHVKINKIMKTSLDEIESKKKKNKYEIEKRQKPNMKKKKTFLFCENWTAFKTVYTFHEQNGVVQTSDYTY